MLNRKKNSFTVIIKVDLVLFVMNWIIQLTKSSPNSKMLTCTLTMIMIAPNSLARLKEGAQGEGELKNKNLINIKI